MLSRVLPEILGQIKANVTTNGTIFDHDGCRDRIQGFLNDSTISNQSSSLMDFIFTRNATGNHQVDYDKMTITYPACNALCGKEGFYIDPGPRFMVWVLPSLLLLSNIELSPIDKRRLVTIAQSGGDPIDCIWSLTAKLDSRKRIYQLVRDRFMREDDSSELNGRPWQQLQDRIRIVSTVLSGFEEIFSAELATSSDFRRSLWQFMNDFGASSDDRYIQRQWQKTALELVDSRTDDMLRAILALTVYVLGLCSAFIADIGGSSTTIPGGVIGVSLSLSFLIPIVILSNAVGAALKLWNCKFHLNPKLHKLEPNTLKPDSLKPNSLPKEKPGSITSTVYIGAEPSILSVLGKLETKLPSTPYTYLFPRSPSQPAAPVPSRSCSTRPSKDFLVDTSSSQSCTASGY
ncbi:hypothetical protein QBC43DRAFT_348593 [Cladorrhinum sp. PSN259]|nr:hypothetical protein QBC43DRAFT_348593 [Cladorrhinum sp. PSN259]